MKKILFLFLSYSLVMNSLWAASVGPGNKVNVKRSAAQFYVDAVAEIYANAFHQSIDSYNQNRHNPKKVIDIVDDKQDRDYFLKLINQNKGHKLPAIENRGGTYFMQFAEGTLRFDLVSIYEGEVYFNNKTYKFKKGLTLSDQANEFALFLSQNSTKTTSLMDLFVPKAEAFICGGLCVGALVGGLVVAGYGVYKLAMGVIGESKDAKYYQKLKNKIVQMNNECQGNLEKIESYSGSYKTYSKITPGSFSSFSMIKGVLDEGQDVDRNNLSKHIMKKLEDKEMDSCKKLTQKIEKSMGPVAYRNAILEGKETDVCPEHDKLVQCLQDMYEVHLSHQGKRNLYDKYYDDKTGVYDESEKFESTSK